MKKVLLTLALVATGFASQAQEGGFGFGKGDILLEGSLQANSQDDKGATVKTSEFNFTPKAGYFVTDKFAVGLGLNIGSGKEENYSNVTENTFTKKGNSVGFEVFGRYYIADLNRFQPYAELGVGYNTSKFETTSYDAAQGKSITIEDPKFNSFGVNASLGFNYFVTPKIAINFALSDVIGFNSGKSDAPNSKATTNFHANINNFNNFFDTATFGLTFKL
ncbi:porin family protein [Flavobacterium sp. xlx-214]|uniref:OmpW family outer membrane protein n=1 Tax=unclassified Flavobacterium TaxID=196869 RepID=UPI0013D7144D|nr:MULTISPECIES: OmpW family outer membrane protein [unclassified Flavobacterium]MBA5791177.1 porin family protein [Flavobacterium sp. xlx-221]QMI83653.1 porin family protein [Flavobacterium sp. xlx-214]